MADLRDYTKKNPVFVGTDGIRLPSGNNAQRTASSNVSGTLRFNTDIDGIEAYTAAGWRPLAAPPSISTVTPSTFSGESGTQFIINGEGFTPDAQVYFVTANSTALLAASVSYYSPVQVRATTPRNITVQEEPISVRVVQQSGTVTKTDCIDAGGLPSWVTTAGTLGSVFGANTVNVYVTATDPEGTAVSYQLSTGALPGGLNLSANGLVQGLANSVLANTTYNFVIKANDTVNNNTDRSFSYTVLNRAPVINTAAGLVATIYSGNSVPTTTISAYDPDGGQIVFSSPTGNIVNTTIGSANGIISGTPIVVTTNTTYTIGVTVTDEGSLTASNNYSFTVLNRPPLWNTAAELPGYSTETFTPITINAYDPDGAAITYTLTSGSVPSGLTFVSANATITGTAPEVESNTTSTFTVTATDVGNDANARTFSLTITPITDSNFANTVLLLKTTGNTVIRDASSNNVNLTVVGDVRPSSFSPFNSSWSVYFDGGSDYLRANSTPMTAGGDLTIECWVFPLSNTLDGIFDGGPGIPNILRNHGTNLFGHQQGPSVNIACTPLVWSHIAMQANSTYIQAYVNGVSRGTSAISSYGVGDFDIGTINTGSAGSFYGYISNFRVSNTRVYLSDFTPPTSPLPITANTVMLTCASNKFEDLARYRTFTRNNDPKVKSFGPFAETDTTSGSLYFDGTGARAVKTLDSSTAYGISGDFTIEFWFYPTSASQGSYNPLVIFVDSLSTDNPMWGLYYNASYNMFWLNNGAGGTGGLDAGNGITLVPFQWTHIALTRTSGTMRLWTNGTLRSSGWSASGIDANKRYIYIGGDRALNERIGGYISNFRFVNGTSLYSSSVITTPNTAFANITNTKLLTFQNRRAANNSGIQDSSGNKFDVLRFGNVSLGSFTPFSNEEGKWSTYFGSGNYFTSSTAIFNYPVAAASSNTATIEAYVYVNAYGGGGLNDWEQPAIVSKGDVTFLFGANSSGYLMVHQNDGVTPRSYVSSTGLIPLNTWVHVAMTISGGVVTLYRNGTSVGSTTWYGLNQATLSSLIGKTNDTQGVAWNGYISNLRVSSNVRSIVVPTEPYQNDSNTVLLTLQSNRFVDRSTNGYTLTAVSNPETSPFGPFATSIANTYNVDSQGASIYFDGTGDYLKIEDSDLWSPNTSTNMALTVDGWFYVTGDGTLNPSSTRAQKIFSQFSSYTGDQIWSLDFTKNVEMATAIASGSRALYSSSNLPRGQWYHFAVVVTGTNLYFYLNGSRVATATATTANYSAPLLIGRLNEGSDGYQSPFNGYIYGFRWQRGVALYTGSTYTIPTSPPTITSNTVFLLSGKEVPIVDYTGKNNLETVNTSRSSNVVSKFVQGSFFFDGSSGNMTIPYTPAFSFGTGDFTVEGWFYFLNTSTAMVPIIYFGDGANGGSIWSGWGLRYQGSEGSNQIMWNRYDGTDYQYTTSGATISQNTWTHIAVSRSSGTLRIFVNGVAYYNNTVNQNFDAYNTTYPLRLGLAYFGPAAGYGGPRYWNGYMSDIRITKGIGRYTTTFTPPTRSFPNR